MTNVDVPPEHKIEPKDPGIYLSTSPWQIMTYNFELAKKSELLNKIFAEEGITIDAPLPATDGKDFFYRNKMEYSLYWDNDEKTIKLAFHQRNSHRKIPFEKSSIERPEILAEARRIIAGLNSEKKEARAYQSLVVRCDQAGNVSSALFENHKPHPKMNLLTDTIMGHKYTYSPNGFFQINLPVYELALKEIKTHIKTEKVLDLYSGVGTIGLSVASDKHLTLVESNPAAFAELEKNCDSICARMCRRVSSENSFSAIYPPAKTATYIPDKARNREKSELAQSSEMTTAYPRSEDVTDGFAVAEGKIAVPPDDQRMTCRTESGIAEKDVFGTHGPIIKPILTKSELALDHIRQDMTVILDPPRAGLDQTLTKKLLEIEPIKIIYLSCNPLTQARDLRLLLEKYRLEKLIPYNFFPRTPHIENLAILSIK